MTVQIERWQFTVSDFARMVDAGILTDDDRVELIAGEIRAMSPIGPQHAAIVKRLNALFHRLLSGAEIVSVQDPIRLSDATQPQPDIAILRPRADFYAVSVPRADDVLLVIEVAETSVDYDRAEKIPRYGQAGIPEAWLVDVASKTVWQFTVPCGDGYINEKGRRRGDSLACGAFESAPFPVNEILG